MSELTLESAGIRGLCAFNAAVAAFSVGVVLFASMACGVA
jgi:hypothetical protein